MDKNISRLFEEYELLLNKIDSVTSNLAKNHSSHMECKKGCDMCCMDYSIFPIEFYSIRNKIKSNQITPDLADKTKENVCVFLNKQNCTIYSQRPIICRTHGLPLLFMNDNSEWELSACELNFTKFNFEEFSLDNTFPQDKYNSKLYLLNKAFIAEFQEKDYGEFDLIPIKNLIDYL